jgi:hypothetical protein
MAPSSDIRHHKMMTALDEVLVAATEIESVSD